MTKKCGRVFLIKGLMCSRRGDRRQQAKEVRSVPVVGSWCQDGCGKKQSSGGKQEYSHERLIAWFTLSYFVFINRCELSILTV